MFEHIHFKEFLLISLCWVGVGINTTTAAVQPLNFSFYGQQMQLSYDPAMVVDESFRINEIALRQRYEELERQPYQPLLLALRQEADVWRLNDWLYARLVVDALQAIYDLPATAPVIQLSAYQLLAHSDYDVRLTYRDQILHVNVYTEDVLYEIPLIQDGGRQYANISSGVDEQQPLRQSMYLLNHLANPTGKAFQFTFGDWPALFSQRADRQVAFLFSGQTIELGLSYDQGVATLLSSYPLVDEQWYLEAPLSQPLRESLLPALSELLQDKKDVESLQLLAAFTRSAFNYRDDKEVFGSNKPMVADELFFYPYSDCEDRSALFYTLVKELLGLPMIVIAYEDHLSIAVAVEGLSGSAVGYQGKRYFFCDPTGPKQSSEIGQVPPGYEGKAFEIIGHYPGQD